MIEGRPDVDGWPAAVRGRARRRAGACGGLVSVEVIAKTRKRFYEDSAEVVMEVVKKLGHI